MRQNFPHRPDESLHSSGRCCFCARNSRRGREESGWCAVSCGLWLAFPVCRLRSAGHLTWRGSGCARFVLGCRRVRSWVCGEVPQFEKVGHLRRSGSVKYPPSCAHPTGSRGVRTIDSLRRSTHLFRYYCCPENFKTAEKYTPKPFGIGLPTFFFKKQTPQIK